MTITLGGLCKGVCLGRLGESLHPARAIISTPVLSCQVWKDDLTRQNGCEDASDRGAGRGVFRWLVAWVLPLSVGDGGWVRPFW